MGSFRNRLLVLIVGLVIAAQSVTFVAVLAGTSNTVEAQAAAQLRSGYAFVRQIVEFRSAQLATAVGILAADFGFREAVGSGEIDTIVSAAQNHARRIGADLVLVADAQGRVMASTAPPDRVPLSAGELITRGAENQDDAHFLVIAGRPYQFFVAPVRAPEVIGWVAMGFAVDDTLARRLSRLAGVHVTLVATSPDGSREIASSLPAPLRAAAGAADPQRGELSQAPRPARLGNEDFLATANVLPGRGDPLVLMLHKSMPEALAPYRDLRQSLLWICGIALLLAVLVALTLARGATRPIAALVDAVQRIQHGRHDVRAALDGSGEEFRLLAGTLDAMQEGIAEREARLRHQALHDPLTELPNRVLAAEELQRRLAALSAGATLGLILLDVHNVREINASLGHHVGDDVLREVARRLSRVSPPSAFISRWAANQFVVVATLPTPTAVLALGRQLTGSLRAGFCVGSLTLDLNVGAGTCAAPEHGSTADELLRRAQIALHDAAGARDHVASYHAGHDAAYQRRLAILSDLPGAIARDELHLVFQPKVSLRSGEVTGVEALVRWTHPELGAVSPAEFVPLAEATGGARALTSWILREGLRQLRRWHDQGLRLDVALNLSAPDILDPDLPEEVLAAIDTHGVPPTSVVLEITEGVVMRDPTLAARYMDLLRVTGIRFAIDDFGSGYSSLAQLGRLPVDELKIDRALVVEALADPRSPILAATVKLGHSMGLKVVAEGVEDERGLDMLRALSCDLVQGYAISRPIAADDVAAFVASRACAAEPAPALDLRNASVA